IADVQYFPPRRATQLPPIGPNTTLLLAQPFLNETVRALQARGATLLPTPYPLGVEGTTAWLRSAADAFGVAPERFASAIAAPAQRARTAIARYRPALEGKRMFWF